jgi:Prp8 binding protein
LLRPAWAANGERVGAGSADRNVYVWDYESGGVKYLLPGHAGAVTEVSFHPSEPIIASCGTDKKVYLGELSLI